MFEQRIISAIREAGRPLKPEELIAAVFGDGANSEEIQLLRTEANQMLNDGELIWISGSGYYLLPPP